MLDIRSDPLIMQVKSSPANLNLESNRTNTCHWNVGTIYTACLWLL